MQSNLNIIISATAQYEASSPEGETQCGRLLLPDIYPSFFFLRVPLGAEKSNGPSTQRKDASLVSAVASESLRATVGHETAPTGLRHVLVALQVTKVHELCIFLVLTSGSF